jgi:zinc D-Ala-D-Ala carboxypeptidase
MKRNPLDRVHPDCPNFKWYEVWKSETASRLELDNESEDDDIQDGASALTVNILQPIRDEHGSTKINSWCRLEPLEKVITKRSYQNWCRKKKISPAFRSSWDRYFARKSHPTGEAADIEVPSISNDDLFDWIAENLEYDQLIREFPIAGVPDSGWVHVSFEGSANRNEKFTIGAK